MITLHNLIANKSIWAMALIATLGLGCSHLQLDSAVADRLSQQYKGRTFWLKQSLYGGTFYDDDRFGLLDSRQFSQLRYLQNLDGDSVLPPPEKEIVALGTKVRISEIAWPDTMNVLKRPLMTPRHLGWVVLTVARQRGSEVTIERTKPYILLIPSEISSQKAFEQWFSSLLSVQDTNPWLLQRPNFMTAITTKKPAVGMNYEELQAALGHPDKLTRTKDKQGITKEIAEYGKTVVVLEGGKVVRFDLARSTQP